MKLADLSKRQWDAAQDAARCMMQGNPNRDADRAVYLAAVSRLNTVLPVDTDARALIREAARWQMLDHIATVCAGLPVERMHA